MGEWEKHHQKKLGIVSPFKKGSRQKGLRVGTPQKALLIYKNKNIPEAKVAVPSRAPLVVPRRETPEWEALGPSLGV